MQTETDKVWKSRHSAKSKAPKLMSPRKVYFWTSFIVQLASTQVYCWATGNHWDLTRLSICLAIALTSTWLENI